MVSECLGTSKHAHCLTTCMLVCIASLLMAFAV